jgi:hypothetical protein
MAMPDTIVNELSAGNDHAAQAVNHYAEASSNLLSNTWTATGDTIKSYAPSIDSLMYLTVPTGIYSENKEEIDNAAGKVMRKLGDTYDSVTAKAGQVVDSLAEHVYQRPLTSLLEGPVVATWDGLRHKENQVTELQAQTASGLLNGTSDMKIYNLTKEMRAQEAEKHTSPAEIQKKANELRATGILCRTLEKGMVSGDLEKLQEIVQNTKTDDLKKAAPIVQRALDLYHTDAQISVNDKGRLVVGVKGEDGTVEIATNKTVAAISGKNHNAFAPDIAPEQILKNVSEKIVQSVKEENARIDRDRDLDAKAKLAEKKAPLKHPSDKVESKTESSKAETKPDKAEPKTEQDKKIEALSDQVKKQSELLDWMRKDWREEKEHMAAERAAIKNERAKIVDDKAQLELDKAEIKRQRAELAEEKSQIAATKLAELEMAKLAEAKRADAEKARQAEESRAKLEAEAAKKSQEIPNGVPFYELPDGNGHIRKVRVDSEEGKKIGGGYSGATTSSPCSRGMCNITSSRHGR